MIVINREAGMALNLQKPVETIMVTERAVVCEGDSGSSMGHPRIYLAIDATGKVDCPYCGRRYVLEDGELELTQEAV